MPTIGLSRPYIAKYTRDGLGGTHYSDGVTMGRAVEYSLEVEAEDSDDFYADNQIAETAGGTFSSGTLTMTTAELEQAVSKMILGAQETELRVGEETVTALVFDDDMMPPSLGFGVIIKTIHENIAKWRAVILTKVKFNIPADAAATQGDAIDWQTSEIEAKVMRDDTEKHRWKIEATFDSEADADAFLCGFLNVNPKPALSALTVTSAAGAETGKTKLTVSPAPASGQTRKYQVGDAAAAVAYDQTLTTGWTSWDGTADLTAENGKTVTVAYVSGDKARAAGSCPVVAKAANP